MTTVKPLSKMTITEILRNLRNGLDGNYFNLDITPGDPDYIPIVIDEPPDYDYKRAIVLEDSDNDCFGFEGDKRMYMTLIISFWYNPQLINEGRDLDVEHSFTYKDAQSETFEIFKKLHYQAPHPFVGRLAPLTVSKIGTEEDLICYAVPYKVYIS